MQAFASRSCLAVALASLLVALPAHADETLGDTANPNDLGEVLATGIVPLFTAMGGGILFMATLVVIAVLFMRPRMPRLPRMPQEA